MTLLKTETNDYVYSPFYHLSDKKSGKIFCFSIKNNNLKFFFEYHFKSSCIILFLSVIAFFMQIYQVLPSIFSITFFTIFLFLLSLIAIYINMSGGVVYLAKSELKKMETQPIGQYIFPIVGFFCLFFLHAIPLFQFNLSDRAYYFGVYFLIFCLVFLAFFLFLFINNITKK